MKYRFLTVLLIKAFTCTLCAQVICDDNICTPLIGKSDLFPKAKRITNPDELERHSQVERARSVARGELPDIDCENPTFFAYVIQNGQYRKKVERATANGSTIEIERTESCDSNRDHLAVPIRYKGENHWAVTGYEGDALFIDRGFMILLTDPDYWCEGLPVEPTKYLSCSICGMKYALQTFKSKIDNVEKTHNFYCYARGRCLNGQNHDGLALKDLTGCAVSKGNKLIRN